LKGAGLELPGLLGPGSIDSPVSKAIREEIEAMAKAEKASPSELLPKYLRNFWLMMPGSGEAGGSAFSDNFQDCMNDTFMETFSKWGFHEKIKPFSELFLSKTPRGFMLDVTEAATECGVNAGDVERWRILRNSSSPQYDPAKFMGLIFPVYVKLRKRGYNYHELTV